MHLWCVYERAREISMDLMSPKEVADMLRIKTKTLYNWMQKGKSPKFLKFGSKVLFDKQEVIAWVKSHEHSSTCEY